MDTKETLFKPRNTSPLSRRRSPGLATDTPLVEGGVYKIVNGKLELVNAPPPPKPPTIKAGQHYKARDSRKIHVWAINKNSQEFPVIGCIEFQGEWRPMVWNLEGITKRPFGKSNDIVAPWSET